MKIITGYRAEPHITAQQDRNVNMGIFGSGTYIVDMGSKLAATVVSANEITIANGLLVAEGCTAEIERGTSESLEIENGSQGMLRTDLIVARYTKASGTGVEDMQLAVITGTPAASNPADPSYNTGSIASGDTLVDFPLYKVSLNGISIESVTRLVDYVTIPSKSYVDGINTTLTNLINTTKTQLQNSINSVSSRLTTVSNRVGTATLNTTAKNALAAINELLTKINANTSNVTDARNRVSALETKTAGIVRTSEYNVAASANGYKQLNNLSTYVLIVNAALTSNTLRGMYLIGVTTSGTLGIKAINTAADVVVVDGGNGLLKVTNNGSATLRCTLIRTYGG